MPDNLEQRKKKAEKMGSGLLGKAARAATSREQMIRDIANEQFGYKEERDKQNVTRKELR